MENLVTTDVTAARDAAQAATQTAKEARAIMGDLVAPGALPQERAAVAARRTFRTASVAKAMNALFGVAAAMVGVLDALIGVGGPADAAGAGTVRLTSWCEEEGCAGAHRRHATGGGAWDAAILEVAVRLLQEARTDSSGYYATTLNCLIEAVGTNDRRGAAVAMATIISMGISPRDVAQHLPCMGRWLRAAALVAAEADLAAARTLAVEARYCDAEDAAAATPDAPAEATIPDVRPPEAGETRAQYWARV
jgi:hypothetical protein